MVGKSDSEQCRKLFIGGLDFRTTDESLKKHFEQWGEVVDVVVMKDAKTKRSKGFGFITFSESSMVDDTQDARPHKVDGREVETKRAIPREESGKAEANVTVKKLFVGGIKDDMEEADLKEHFEQFGSVQSVNIVTEKGGDKKRGFGFIEFDDYDAVDKCILNRSQHNIKGKHIDVKKALSKQHMQEAQQKMANKQGGNFRGGPPGPWGRGGGDNFGNSGGGYNGGGGYGGGQGGGNGPWGGDQGNWGGNQGGGGGGWGNQGGNQGGGGGGWGGNQGGNQGGGGGWGGNQGGNQGGGGGWGGNQGGNQGGGGGWGGNQGGNQGGGGGWGGNQGGNQGGGGGWGGNQGGGNQGGWGGNQGGGYGNMGGGGGGGGGGSNFGSSYQQNYGGGPLKSVGNNGSGRSGPYQGGGRGGRF